MLVSTAVSNAWPQNGQRMVSTRSTFLAGGVRSRRAGFRALEGCAAVRRRKFPVCFDNHGCCDYSPSNREREVKKTRAGREMIKKLSTLIVEDSEADAELMVRELQDGGFDPVYERVDTQPAMIAALDRRGWEINISGYSLPRVGGDAAPALL